MKGIVFTEFLEMVESSHGYQMVDQLIEESNLPSKGIYTAVGTYDHQEIVQLVVKLSSKTNTEVPALLRSFGHHLFETFAKSYPHFFNIQHSAFDFLESIEQYIHVHVKKLYPDAQLPTFITHRPFDNQLEMLYKSERSMSALALGLIEKTMDFYDEPASIQQEQIDDTGQAVKFLITKTA